MGFFPHFQSNFCLVSPILSYICRLSRRLVQILLVSQTRRSPIDWLSFNLSVGLSMSH